MEEVKVDYLQDVVQAVQGFYARKDPAHDLSHALRVRGWGKRLAEEEGANVLVVELAAILHDIGRSGAVEKTHAESSAGLAASILEKCGYSEDISAQVREAIITHSREAGYEPRTLEAQVLYDADKLDFVGPVGLARLFAMGGAQNWEIIGENSCEEFYRERVRSYAANIYTLSGKRLFEPLFKYTENFWQELYHQWLR